MIYNNSTIDQINSTTIKNENHFLKIPALVINWFALAYVLTSNFLLIYGLIKTKGNRKLTMSKRLFIYLSTVDIMTAASSVVLTHLKAFGYFYRVSSYIINALTHALHIMGCLAFVSITVLRFISIRYPMRIVSGQIILTMLLLGLTRSSWSGLNETGRTVISFPSSSLGVK